MPLDMQLTTLRQSPYYDDYDETKNFHRVLFKPSVAVQARELTQLQTILQNQIERFGDNIYQTGTIIKGCSLTSDDQYYYVKLFDNQINGDIYDLPSLVNTYVVESSSNLHALSINYKTGGQQQDPDLNTLYLKYLNTGTSGQKSFSNASPLTIYSRDYGIEKITVNSGGTLYSNSDSVVFSGGTGAGATATITTYANGTIRYVNVVQRGQNYTTAPSASVSTATGTGATITPVNYLAQISSANNLYTAPTGQGYAVKTSDGIIYQKGHFIRVGAHDQIVSKYTTAPDGVVVGFATTEAVVNSNSDQTLLDNANTSTNYTAPGADRLKLTANLVVLTTAAAAANNDFLALYEYSGGRVVKDRTTTQFNSVNKELSKRTYEESGNYVVDPIPLYTETITGNTTHLNLVAGAGLAYVEGNRIQIYNNTKIPVRKSTDTISNQLQTISTNYGGYVYVKELFGNFNIKLGEAVSLRNAAGQSVTNYAGGSPTAPGTQIGTALVRSIAYDSGIPGTPDCQYRLYLFNVTMSQGFSFKDVRAVSVSGVGVADVVLDSASKAIIYDLQYDTLIFDTGTTAVQTLTSETFISRSQTNATFATGGTLSVSFAGGNTLPYTAGSTLNSVQERDFIIVPQTTLTSSVAKSGTVAITSGANTVTGTSTSFTTQYNVGQYIAVGAQTPQRITRIASDAAIQVATNFGASATAQTHTIAYPANVPIDFQDDVVKTISIDGTQTTLILSLGHNIASTGTVSIYHDIQTYEPAVKVKTVNNPIFVKLSTTSLANTTGPWSLGIPDAYAIDAVYVGVANTYSNTVTNYVNEFVLDSGQNDNFYGLAYIKKRPGSTLPLANTNCLLVQVRAFTTGTGKYISTESYSSLIDDVSSTLPSTKIRTQDIPVYVSPKNGHVYDLRNVIDFRPLAANTANLSSTVAGATIDPSATVSFSASDKFFPSPLREFNATITSYMTRRDRLVIDTYGTLKVLEGVPANSPSAPSEPRSVMTLGLINVAQYPSLSAKDANDSNRPDLGVYVTPNQTKRYTMSDISDIDRRINRLEYYTLLNTLEQNTKQITLPGEANSSIERFKNGFFVDPLTDYNVSNLNSPEYTILVDTNAGVARPNYKDVKVDLIYDSANSTGTTQTGDLITLSYTTPTLLSQPIANKQRTLVDQYWKYSSSVSLFPPYDNYYDITRSAVSIAVDIGTPLNALARATSAALSQLNVSTNIDKVTNIGSAFMISTNGSTDTFQQNVVKTITDTKVKVNPGQEIITQQDLGNYVTDFTLRPYIRDQRIQFFASGLRPSATHYVFFDNVAVSSYVTPCSVNLLSNPITEASFTTTGAKGSTLTSDANGVVAGFFDLPANTFFVGERSLVIMDVNNVASETSATSKSIGTFVAYAYNVDKTNLSIATKTIDVSYSSPFTVSNYTNTYNVSDKTYFTRPTPRSDPISQTFRVQRQQANTDGLFVTSVDLYFQRKDATQGVTLEIRETNNGVPTEIVLPFSRTYVTADNVAISNDATQSTTFTFKSPVYLRTETDYAITIYPDANSPEYLIWTAQAGVPDVANTNLLSNQNWGLGTLFYSTSGSAWTPVQDEDMKFSINRALFNGLTGTAQLQNGDYEFLTLANTAGLFLGGEDIAQLSTSYLSGTFTTNSVSTVIGTSSSQLSSLSINDYVLLIYGNNAIQSTGNVNVTGVSVTNGGGITTSFNTDYANGDFIRLGSEIRQVVAVTNSTAMTIDATITGTTSNAVHYRMAPYFNVRRVTAANSSTITVNKLPSITSNSTVIVNGQKVVRGIVSSYESSNSKIYISNSTSANDSFKIHAANSTYVGTIIGSTSQTRGNVSSVDNIPVNIFSPLINTLQIPGTTIALSGTLTKNSGSTDTRSYLLTTSNQLDLSDDAIVKSKSNEIVGTNLTKSFKAALTFGSSITDSSPVIDINPSSVVLTRNLINNDVTNETTSYGNALTKYVSKRIVLADGMDAEDAKVYITAYKPSGTGVYVYAKILNSSDGNPFEENDWTLLTQETASAVYSSSLDPTDYREFSYTFPKTPPSTQLAGVVTTYSNTTINGTGTTFDTTLVAGDLVKIVKSNTLTDYDLLPVVSVANSSQFTVSSNVSFTGTGNVVERVTQPKAAFKYTRNNYVARYYDKNKASYDRYKYLAVKIVLVSPYNYLVPTLNDVRVLCVSV